MRLALSATLTDGQLLESYLQQRDPSAFAVLVERHGGMVMGLCQRLLHHAQDAEDVFQAVFLVLLRKAASLRGRESIGPWLYTVAYRAALKIKRGDMRRRQLLHGKVMTSNEPADSEAVWRELSPVLDEELNRLPAKYHSPVVLCFLQGLTNAEAARALGWPEGTLKSRLARGRSLLRQRLSRNGVVLSLGVLAALVPAKARASVRPFLVEAVTKAAAGRGGSASAHLSPASRGRAEVLARSILKSMGLAKAKKVLAAIGAVALLLGASGALLDRAWMSARGQCWVLNDLPNLTLPDDGGPDGALVRVASIPAGQELAALQCFADGGLNLAHPRADAPTGVLVAIPVLKLPEHSAPALLSRRKDTFQVVIDSWPDERSTLPRPPDRKVHLVLLGTLKPGDYELDLVLRGLPGKNTRGPLVYELVGKLPFTVGALDSRSSNSRPIALRAEDMRAVDRSVLDLECIEP